ncbi:MAG: cytochrome c [Clostridia bacterium]|nr:MAG: cytochrome c [Clostridia bacterium]
MQYTKHTKRTLQKMGLIGAILLLALLLSSCTMDMKKQPHYESYEASAFFVDGSSARPLVADTVPHGQARLDDMLYTGMVDGSYAEEFPFPITKEDIQRGHERYDIYCAPCHGMTGAGDGMIVQRGFKQPPSLNQDRLRDAAPGYFYYAIDNGFGAMPSYANRIPVRDRWLIIAYIRALQLSQHASVSDLPQADQAKLEATQ